MSSEKPSSNVPTSRPRQPLLTARRVLTAIQIILICGVGIAVGQTCLSMLHSSPDGVRAAGPQEVSSLPPMPVAFPAAGTWVVDNSPLALGIEVIATDRLAERMAVPPRGMSQNGAAGGSCDDCSLASIRTACQVSHAPNGYTVYSLDQPRMKLRLFSTGCGTGERLLGGYLAYPRERGRWTLVVGTCKGGDPQPARQPHLLPLTARARSIAARIGGKGELQCEVIELRGDLEDLCRHWRDCGWRVASERSGDGQSSLSCSKGNAHVYLRMRHETGAAGRCILLAVAADALLDTENHNSQTERASS
jgi:hypothetical protein